MVSACTSSNNTFEPRGEGNGEGGQPSISNALSPPTSRSRRIPLMIVSVWYHSPWPPVISESSMPLHFSAASCAEAPLEPKRARSVRVVLVYIYTYTY